MRDLLEKNIPRPAPLRDLSGGILNAWPGGFCLHPNGNRDYTFRPAEPDENPVAEVHPFKDRTSIYCKYCCQDVVPLALHELVGGRLHQMLICSECAYGLTPPEEVDQ